MTIAANETRTRRTQEERRAESDRRIVESAIALFAEQGYWKTTLNQVGERAGYTGGLVSSRFGSKENLLKAVVDEIGTVFHERFRADSEGTDTRAMLHRFVGNYLRDVPVRPAVRALYVIMGEALAVVPEANDKIAALSEHTLSVLVGILQEGKENGTVSAHVDPGRTSMTILSMVRGASFDQLLMPDIFVVEDAIESINDFIDRYCGFASDD